MKSYSQLYDEYCERYNKPKHNFSHFITTLASIHHHRKFIRPSIKWWYDLK